MSDGEDASGPTEERQGTLLSSRYELVELIGSGGMGEVWRANDSLLNREVAVKLLHARHMADRVSRERFRTEGRITAVLSHPGIAQVFDYGEQDDIAFLVMEFIPGEPLSAILDRYANGLEPPMVVDIIVQVARALGAAHARGVVHRDLKPGNLMVTGDGTVKLTDFGIARGNESLGLTQTGMVMGTAQYISPEQASGSPATPASDLYALGVVAYECLSGSPPFHADSPLALALAHVRDTPPPLPDHLPVELRDLVDSLLRKTPEDRPGTSAEVIAMAQGLPSDPTRLGGAATSVMSQVPTSATPVQGDAVGDAPTMVSTGAKGTTSTQPNPPIDAAAEDDGDGSVRLADKPGSGMSRRSRILMVAIAAVAVLAIGTVALSQLLNGSGDDGQVDGGTEPSPSPIRESTESSPTDDPEPEPELEEPPPAPDPGYQDDGSGGGGTQYPEPTHSYSEPPPADPTTDPTEGEVDPEPDPDPGGEDPPPDTGGGNGPDQE
ncbi:serine/threonine protein kinase [Spiractinospora alimapuensis]|uniref:serine/threonine-protein kinase n=1 Tax=Spiractinospora alimapuensis TaxID=2820884 RepID=UPI001F38DCAA|nr:serine/threonine-protein kinase [Spiractinospora alimapuensis]QVQ50454.1 serine/threonine protein kinase [Spiractinospora alimapuensis]